MPDDLCQVRDNRQITPSQLYARGVDREGGDPAAMQRRT